MMSRIVWVFTCSIFYFVWFSSGIWICGGAGRGLAVADRGTELEDVSQHPRHGHIQTRRNLVTDLHAAMQGPGQRRRLEDRNPVFGSYFTDSGRIRSTPLATTCGARMFFSS